ncbi:MAG: hypothetical protein GWN87_09770, partial [Desulfuromonadales bacterium]|nr:hypothetical protein [Desulfuromonadales bacterium]
QSVALRLICEREKEIKAFVPREYWSIEADLKTEKGEGFKAKLHKVDGKKLDKFAIESKKQADELLQGLQEASYQVASL